MSVTVLEIAIISGQASPRGEKPLHSFYDGVKGML